LKARELVLLCQTGVGVLPLGALVV